jgi:topoisomerase-4 subunit A
VLVGDGELDILLSSGIGYGFITKLSELYSKNRAGKSILNFPEDSYPLHPVVVGNMNTDRVVAVSNEGRLLVFPITQLPVLPKGKGNKIISVLKDKGETLTMITILPENGVLLIHAGKRSLSLSEEKLAEYIAERGRRGKKLPQGYRHVDRIEVVQHAEPGSGEDLQLSIIDDGTPGPE